LFLLSIDEGITGYRDDSLEVQNCLIPWTCCELIVTPQTFDSTILCRTRFQTVSLDLL
jgi:hypothetical protein